MKKIYAVFALLFFVFIAGCSTDETQINIQEINESENIQAEDLIEDLNETIDNPQENIPEVQDAEIYSDENISLSIEDGVYIAEVETNNSFNTAPFSEWCIPGEVFSLDSDEAQVDSTIIGVTTYKGNEVCEAEHLMITPSPMGDLEIKTTYYMNEEISEIWVLTDAMGQVTETYVNLK